MRAIEFQRDQNAQVVSIADPRPSAGEVVLRVLAAGICGSDVTALKGQHPFRIPPLISGHEAGGVVVERGSGVTSVELGDRVAIEPQVSCQICVLCASGHYYLCRSKVMLGVAEWPGALAEYVAVPASTVHVLPDSVADELSALIEPIAVAAHAVRQTGDVYGTDVAVLGGGPIGALLVHQLVRAGAASVTATDPRAENRRLCAAMGASHTFDPTDARWQGDALSATRAGGFATVFVAATVPHVVDEAVSITSPRGTIVQVALLGKPINFTISALQMSERRLIGSNNYSRLDFGAAIDTAAQDPLVVAGIINARGGLDRAAQYLNDKAQDIPDAIVKFVVDPRAETIERAAP